MSRRLHIISILALVAITSAQHADFYREMSYEASLTDIPTDPNFNVTTFVGDWNVVGIYGIGIGPHSCPTVNVKKTVTTSLSITMTSINISTSTFNVASKTYQPSPLNKAILIDILTTSNRQNVAVSYYNDTLGQALLINENSLFAVALSKSDNIYTNMFLETVNDIFIEAGLPLNQTVFTDQYGCSTNYTVASDFNIKSFPGTYYGNAVYTLSPALANLSCYNVKVQKDEQSNKYNVTQYLQYNDSLTNFSTTFIPSPSSSAFLLNIDDTEIPSLVVNYYLAADNLYVLLAHDGTYALIVSNKQTLDESTISSVKDFLTKENLTVNAQTFFVSPKACQVSEEDNNDFLSIIS